MTKSKIFAGVITIAVLLMLVISGPVEAVNLNLIADRSEVTHGNTIKFTISMDIDSDERFDINYFALKIVGPTSETCKFDINGIKLSSCAGITQIELISNSATYGYGYGYGYTDGVLEYEVTLDTDNYHEGDYQTELQISTDTGMLSKVGSDFVINPRISGTGTGSSSGDSTQEEPQSSPEKFYLNQGDELNFVYNGENHKLVVNGIGETMASFTVFSEPNKFNLNLSEIKRIDLNNDGVEDIELEILFIGQEKETLSLSIKPIDGELKFNEIIKTSDQVTVKQTETKKYSRVSTPNKNLIYQLQNFGFIWVLLLINLITVELVGIVGSSKK